MVDVKVCTHTVVAIAVPPPQTAANRRRYDCRHRGHLPPPKSVVDKSISKWPDAALRPPHGTAITRHVLEYS